MSEIGSQHTPGELTVAFLLGGVSACLAAIAGWVGTAALCFWLLPGEMGEWALILGPASALLCGTITYFFVFRWIKHYGE